MLLNSRRKAAVRAADSVSSGWGCGLCRRGSFSDMGDPLFLLCAVSLRRPFFCALRAGKGRPTKYFITIIYQYSIFFFFCKHLRKIFWGYSSLFSRFPCVSDGISGENCEKNPFSRSSVEFLLRKTKKSKKFQKPIAI